MKTLLTCLVLALAATTCSEHPVAPELTQHADSSDSTHQSNDASVKTTESEDKTKTGQAEDTSADKAGSSTNTSMTSGDMSTAADMKTDSTMTTQTGSSMTADTTPPVTFKALTFNVYTAKAEEIASSVKSVNPDIACIQEASITETKDAAKLLGSGWIAVTLPDNFGKNSEYGFLSRHPLARSLGQTTVGRGVIGAVFKIGDKEAAFFCHHGAYQDFGPRNYYAKKVTLEQAINQEKTNRESIMKEVLAFIEPQKKANLPVFLMGDFNTASHEDYDPVINWPITKLIRDSGYADSWREVNKNVPSKKLGTHLKTDPGITWYRLVREAVDFYTRMDFIFYAGPAKAVESKTVDLAPSDHFSLYTVFELK